MTPAETAIREALAAGPTPGPWRFSSHPHDGNYMRITCSSDPAEGDNLRGYCGEANARFIAACNPAALAELLAELDGERNRSQMYADLVRGVAVVLHGEGWSDTSKLPEEVAALKADLDRLRAERDAAVGLLASWCVSVDHNGTGWDDWDEDYKDARYRPGPLRAALDKAIAEERQHRGITGD